jgi:hypothetical protein
MWVSKTLGGSSNLSRDAKNAGVAQLVEHFLAKEDVTSSSLVTRSNKGKYEETLNSTHIFVMR